MAVRLFCWGGGEKLIFKLEIATFWTSANLIGSEHVA